MDTFGDRLKTERENRGLTNQALAEVLRVDHDLLLSLERNDFAVLPDEAAMMACLRAYAECLQVDAGLMIDDYVRERDKWTRRLEDVEVEQVAATAPPAMATEAERRRRFSPWLVVLVVVGIAMLAAWWLLAPDGSAPTPETSVASAPVEPQPVPSTPPREVAPTLVEQTAEIAPTLVKPPAAVAPTPVKPPESRSSDPNPAPSLLSIAEYGVGTAVENRYLVGRNDRFTAGTRVWFWTRVQGGTRGDRIDHVWLHEGVEATHLSLKIGGSNWRTYSAQTLYSGVAGDWAVEARDEAGRVLARSEFVCVP
jgi:cytoskeletal protein RodZ